MQHCPHCNAVIDTDLDAEHFEECKLNNQKTISLYHHKTSGGAEYLMDTYHDWSHNGKSGKEGVINDKTKYIVRIDGDITKDVELTIR